MKPTPAQAWKNLAAAARRAAADSADTAAPFGFATRVVAQALTSAERPVAQVIEKLSWRALGISFAVTAAAVALNLSPVLHSIDDEVSELTETEATELAAL